MRFSSKVNHKQEEESGMNRRLVYSVSRLADQVRLRLSASRSRFKDVAKRMWDAYEDLIGIREIRRTQESVLKVLCLV